MDNVKAKIGDKISYADDMYDALSDADALVICTEWSVFRNPDFDKIKAALKEPVVFDGRNLFELPQMKQLGFYYASIGRSLVNETNAAKV